MEKTTNSKTSRSARILILILFLSLILMYFVSEDMERIGEVVRRSGWIGLVACTILYGLLGASVIPSEPLTVLLAAIYGPFMAAIAASLGNLLAAVFEYYIGTHIGDAASFTERKEKLPWGLGHLPIESPMLLVIGRMIPGYGSKLISILAGIYHVKIWRYVWTTAIPTLVGAAITAYGGSGLLNLVRNIQAK
ncbi:MAG TPA: VTT domain-containing protein [Anaerolineaceae bacterium]|nr:VTT domain-containing protein [Anaerolineaceae bacterium]